MAQTQRKPYSGAYRTDIEDEVVTPTDSPASHDSTTGSEDPAESPEDRSWKKRYSDSRSYQNTLTDRIRSLETQLQAAQKQEIKIPSSKEELGAFAQKYPDVYRHIRSIAMTELLQERENIVQETKVVTENLEKIQKEFGIKKILQAHPDFEELNMSEAFHEWGHAQPKQIQDWLYENDDPALCIKALDLFKAETNFKQKKQPTPRGADTVVKPRSVSEVPTEVNGKKVWKTSEIRKMHPKQYEKYETEIENARVEGRLEVDE